MWWREHLQVTVRLWCQYFVDAEVIWEGKTCRITGFYDEPDVEHRKKSWDAIRYLRRQDELPWLCLGDFNEALLQLRKWAATQEVSCKWKTFEIGWLTAALLTWVSPAIPIRGTKKVKGMIISRFVLIVAHAMTSF